MEKAETTAGGVVIMLLPPIDRSAGGESLEDIAGKLAELCGILEVNWIIFWMIFWGSWVRKAVYSECGREADKDGVCTETVTLDVFCLVEEIRSRT